MADITHVEQQIAIDEEIIDIPIFQKNGDPYLAADGSQSTIGTVGSESKRYKDAADRSMRRTIRGKHTRLEPKDIRQGRITQAADGGVVRWHGWESGGKDWPCEPENVKALLRADHILEQVEAGIQGHADFFAKRSES